MGDSNRDISPRVEASIEQGIINITWAINDNFTEGMVVSGARADVVDMLEAIVTAGLEYEVIVFNGTFSMVDTFGNSSESNVVRVSYSKETVDKINFSQFLSSNAFVIADTKSNHPLFDD